MRGRYLQNRRYFQTVIESAQAVWQNWEVTVFNESSNAKLSSPFGFCGTFLLSCGEACWFICFGTAVQGSVGWSCDLASPSNDDSVCVGVVTARSVVGRERVGTAFPHLSHDLLQYEFEDVWKWLVFWGAFPHLFC